MKFTIDRNSLLKSLGHVQSVVERRNTIPILSNVLIEAIDGAVRFTATDLDLAVVEQTAADTVQPGATTAPAHTLFDIIRAMPDGSSVEISMGDDGRLAIRAGRSRFTLAVLPREDFPQMAGGQMPTGFKILAADCRRLIDKSRFAISTEETRYYLNGIYLHVADGKGLRAVATDGHRLAQVQMEVPAGARGMPGVIVPRKTVAELRKLIDEFEGDVHIALSDTKIRFDFSNVVLTSKLIDGTFPDYTRVIPTGNDKSLDVDCDALREAVARVSTISSEKTRSVKLAIQPDRVVLSVTSPESGTATEELAASYAAEPMEIGFNSRYLLDILDQIGGDNVRASLADPGAPTVIRDAADEGVLYVLMPMRV